MTAFRSLACITALATSCAGAAHQDKTASATDDPAVVVPPARAAASVHAVGDLEVAFKQAIARVGPAVVSIYSTKTVELRRRMSPFGDPSFDRFFDLPPGQIEQRGLGSGFVIDGDGHVLTNNHVIDGAQDIRVKLADGRELEAQIVGTDPPTDLALLKIDAADLSAADLGDSDGLEAGDWVIAIGSPFGLSQTVSAGIVSAVARANVGILDYEDFIQTDAAINLGNSGGPLVDLDGRVIGINTAIASNSGGNLGIAFAVPVNMAKTVVDQLRERGTVSRGQLGVVISELSPELAESFHYTGKGILVQDVRAGSAAQKAGVQNGDIIVALQGEPVSDVAKFRNAIARTPPGTRVTLDVWRERGKRSIAVTLDSLSGDAKAPGSPAAAADFGLGLEDATPASRRRFGLDSDSAVIVARVTPGSPAARAGLRPGDVLEQVGERRVTTAAEANQSLASAGDRVRLRLRRENAGRYVVLERK